MPGEDFWRELGSVLGTSPWWAALSVVVLALLAKLWLPEWRKDRDGRRDMEKRRMELEAKAQADDDQQARERIRLTERQLDIQADQTRALEALTAQTTLLNARIEASRKSSARMGEAVDRIDTTTSHTDTLVEDIHRHIVGGEGTD